MPPRLSLYLDVLRFSAALVVLLSHLAFARFTNGDLQIFRTLNLGSDAVVVFFVLSGFVIAYASERDRTLGRYVFHRATRLYSVAVPAIVLTLVCDWLGAALAPAVYDGWWYTPAPAGLVLLHGLTFSNEWGPFGFQPGTNSSYWSLSYEAGYYLLFGVAFFTRGMRRLVLLGGMLALLGIKVLLLAPGWLLGVAAYRALQSETREHASMLWALALGAPLLYVVLLAGDAPRLLLAISAVPFGPSAIKELRFSNEFLWNGLVGLLVALHIYGAGALLKRPASLPRGAETIRWFAGASFSIYLVHFPILELLQAALPPLPIPLLRHFLLFAGMLAVSLIFAQFFERPLGAFRRALVSLLQQAQRLSRVRTPT
jgi:peptidoglycan/LPS O-acetylase OafA/YrhL